MLLAVLFGIGSSTAWADSYELVTNASQLSVGDVILITNAKADGSAYALGPQSGNNCPAKSVTISSSAIADKRDAQEITLYASSGGNYVFKVAEDTYLYAASNSSNQLKTSSNTTYWSIAINTTTNVATITDQTHSSNHNKMKYNSNNGSPLFSCYTSADNNLFVFRKVTATLSSIALSGTYPTTFHQGDAFSHEGMTVMAAYDDASEADVTSSATFSGYDMSSIGVQTVTVSYTENEVTKTATYDITVSAPATLTSIALSGTYPTVFDYGAAFSSEGIVVTANYDDDTNKVVTGSATFSGYNMTTAGAQTVTVSYTEDEVTKTQTYGITVNAYVQPTEFDINFNDAFFGTSYGGTASGITDENPESGTLNNVTVTYAGSGSHYINSSQIRFYPNNKLTFEAPLGYNITQIIFSAGDTWTATISADTGTYTSGTKTWAGEATSVLFTGSGSGQCRMTGASVTLAKQKELSSIAVSGSYPTVFEVGDAFSHEGAVVTATYDDASNADVTSGATFSTPDMSAAGTKTITVSYTENAVEKTTTYNITVKTPATFESIALSGSYPTTFNVGDAFSHEGMTVTANFDDETSTDVTTSATFTGYDMSAAGVQTVTVSYTHKGVTTKTTTYNITVNTVAVTGVTVAPTAASLYVGETTTLTATVSPNNATNKKVTWTSSDGSVATVSAAGVVTAVAAGTATITVTTEDGSQTATCAVTVEEVVDYVTLPFAWEGGSSASLTESSGVTASGLGSDYADQNAPYLVKFDSTGDYVQIKTDSRPDVVTIGVKMIGGANTSYITVKASTDGETFDEGEQLTISGSQNSVLTLTSTRSFDADVRYIRLLFTRGSNVGVGSISISKYIPKYAFTFAANPAAAGTVTATYSAEDVTSGDTFAEGIGLSISAAANAGYTFSGWTEENDLGTFANASNASTTYTMPGAAAAISANFTVNNYDLSIEEGVNGSYTTTVNGEAWDGSSKIPYGATVSITAVPDDSYVFSSWDATLDAYNTTANPLVFTMPADEVAIEGSFVSAAIEYTIDIDDEVTGGSIEASANSATAGTEITLTPTPASGYQFVSWTVLDGSANEVTVTNNKFTMPGSDVTVSATFKQIFTVTYFVNGVENSVERLDGATLSLDDPAALASMSFAGWSESNNATSPVFVPNSTAITSNKTLYAYFIASSNYTYQLVESEQDDWRGDYLIAYSSSIFADGRTGGTGGIGAQNVSVNPGTNLVGKTVKASWGDTYNVTIEAVDNSDLSNGYVLKTKDEKYNYQTSNTNGLASSENKNTAAEYPITVTFTSSADIKLALGGSAAGAVFRYNPSGFFRFYKDGGQKSVYLYKKVLTGVNYSLGTTAVTIAQACTDGEKYYGTFSHGSSFIVPADVTVSEIAVSDGKLVVTDYEEGDIVPANTGVMISAEDYGGKSFVLTTAAGEAKTATNALKASGNSGINAGGMTTAAPDCVYYRLTMHNGTDFGFYWGAAEGAAFSLAANKAYLAVPKAAGVKEFFTFDNLATAIHSMRTEESNDAIFNLAGQKISRLQKGINIVNGKKIFIK